MEVYAGFLEHTDHHVGRLDRRHRGARRRSTTRSSTTSSATTAPRPRAPLNGAFNEMANFNGMAALETPGVHGVQSRTSSARRAPTTTTRSAGPGRWTRRTSGPSRWPRTGAAPATARSCTGPTGSPSTGGLRHQFTHVIDVAPTILEAAGLPEPTIGATGCSSRRSRARAWSTPSTTPTPPERHDLQYFEMFGNRGIYHKGWSAVTKHRTPVGMAERRAAGLRRRRVGALRRHATTGPRPTTSPPSSPRCCAKLQRLWLIEADEVQRAADRRPDRFERFNADHRRPAAADHRATPRCSFPGMGGLSENSVIDIKNKSFSVTADDRGRPNGPAERRDHRPGRPVRRLGALRQGRQRASSSTTCWACRSSPSRPTEQIPAGSTRCAMEFAYDGGGLAKGGDVTLYYDGAAVGTGRVEVTQPMVFSADETTDIGYESGCRSAPTTPAASQFTGKIDVGADRRRRRRPRPPDRPQSPGSHRPPIATQSRRPAVV